MSILFRRKKNKEPAPPLEVDSSLFYLSLPVDSGPIRLIYSVLFCQFFPFPYRNANRNTENVESNNEYSLETDVEAEEYTLTALEQEIRKNNAGLAVQLVKKAGAKVRVFQNSWLVVLAIPSKIRKSTEMKRLLCCIVKVVKN
jgi:hypothetical protein